MSENWLSLLLNKDRTTCGLIKIYHDSKSNLMSFFSCLLISLKIKKITPFILQRLLFFHHPFTVFQTLGVAIYVKIPTMKHKLMTFSIISADN